LAILAVCLLGQGQFLGAAATCILIRFEWPIVTNRNLEELRKDLQQKSKKENHALARLARRIME